MNRCRSGHESEESDYCSVCGVAMVRAAASPPLPARASKPPANVPRGAAPASSASLAAHVFCPDCGEERAATARFCEVCRFDFVSGTGASPQAHALQAPAPSAASAPPVNAPALSSNEQMNTAAATFELVVASDPSLDTEPDADTPKVASETIVPLLATDLLVGRRDDRRDIHPDIAVDDPGASRRHAKFVRQADGSVALQDLASTNGTKINGVDVAAGTRQTLALGDAVTLGRWTRITLRSSQNKGVS